MLRRGKRSSVWVTPNSMAYKMSNALPADTVYVVINRGDNQDQVQGLPSGALKDLLSGQTFNGPTVTVPARTSLILVP